MATAQKKRPQAHNLSPDDMESLQVDQMAGDVKSVKVKGKRFDGSSYTIPSHEKHLVHAEIFNAGYNSQTGEPLGTSFVQTFYPAEFERMKKQQAFAGAKVAILHDGNADNVEDIEPTDYLTPQVVSSPGAGIPLTISKDDLKGMKVSELQGFWNELNPGSEESAPNNKGELIEGLTSRLAFLNDPGNAETMQAIENNRRKAAEPNK
jgi:hypothetical protein